MASDNFPHDAAYKAFFSTPEMVKSLLKDFVPEDFIGDFDFDTLEVCSGSSTTLDLQKRDDDIVWRVKWKNAWCYVYILLEFQSAQDPWMALRIATYTGLLWQELVRQGEVKVGEKLPPVLPIVVYNGESPWKAPVSLMDLVAPIPRGLTRYQLSQEYFLLDENRISDFLLDRAEGEAGYIFRFERARSPERILAIYNEFKGRISGQKYALLRRSVRVWLVMLMEKRNMLVSPSGSDLEDEEDNIMLEQKFRQWEQEFICKGKAEGLAEGLSCQKTTLLEMLYDRFGTISNEWQEAIARLDDAASVSRLIRAVYRVKSPEEYGALLDAH